LPPPVDTNIGRPQGNLKASVKASLFYLLDINTLFDNFPLNALRSGGYMAAAERLISAEEATQVSPVAKKMLSAIGYDIDKLNFARGLARSDPRTEWRVLSDPERKIYLTIQESFMKEAPATLVALEDLRKHAESSATTTTEFIFDRVRQSLMTTRYWVPTDPSTILPQREVIVTNFATGRTYHAEDALIAMGALYWSQPVTLAKPDLVRQHEAVARAVRVPPTQPALTP
jgi:hypothetical protein